mmetsp:Transcript_80016/g.239709  ORF Transcript_80016/g.239709 Transcript_80016/m.239709 type:complete len:140 (+) Transcript_80016:42-461(+)
MITPGSNAAKPHTLNPHHNIHFTRKIHMRLRRRGSTRKWPTHRTHEARHARCKTDSQLFTMQSTASIPRQVRTQRAFIPLFLRHLFLSSTAFFSPAPHRIRLRDSGLGGVLILYAGCDAYPQVVMRTGARMSGSTTGIV